MSTLPIIAIDFDGTVVTHEYPRLGRDLGAIPWLIRACNQGAKLILLTMRSGDLLQEAQAYCEQVGLSLWSVNANPLQTSWSESPKVYAHLYIDDSGLGMPLVRPALPNRPFVDWPTAGPMLMRWLETWQRLHGSA